jgi:hypothetical protein
MSLQIFFTSFLILFCLGHCAQFKLPFEDRFPKGSKYDAELRKILPAVYSEIRDLEEVINVTSLVTFRIIEKEISRGKYKDETLEQLDKICQLVIKRNFILMRDFYEDFKKNCAGVDNAYEWYMEFGKNPENEDILKTFWRSSSRLIDLKLSNEIYRFKKELAPILPVGNKISEVDYEEYIKLNYYVDFDMKLVRLIAGGWMKSIEILWYKCQHTRGVIRKHGEFWLNYIKLYETKVKLLENVCWVNPPTTKLSEYDRKENLLITNFFRRLFHSTENKGIEMHALPTVFN